MLQRAGQLPIRLLWRSVDRCGGAPLNGGAPENSGRYGTSRLLQRDERCLPRPRRLGDECRHLINIAVDLIPPRKRPMAPR
jgi:hypothetical protein